MLISLEDGAGDPSLKLRLGDPSNDLVLRYGAWAKGQHSAAGSLVNLGPPQLGLALDQSLQLRSQSGQGLMTCHTQLYVRAAGRKPDPTGPRSKMLLKQRKKLGRTHARPP
jgi:hypothetical protein